MEKKTLADYEIDIPQVAELLHDDEKLATFFMALTPGYQREWARFIFGAKAPATRQKHIDQMKVVFKAGFKSKRAYDQREK
ncbi:YdeI/OmpD-associated family protein [Paucilactobacillus kaifaensis]|uniref:YdeI/OmpD-associated family protein n=1 Tax=Paucilactobacillus kaifaensis TaxID=2559921 RepID=UPI0010F82845|nr:YdeI/OmpD-associated family protein [Paucilactobacillus kaifaensis]